MRREGWPGASGIRVAPGGRVPGPLLGHQLQRNDGRAVTEARAEADDARVAPSPALEARTQLVEHLAHDVLVVDVGQGLTARRERALLAERDHLLGQAAHLLGLGLRRLDL